MAIKSIVMPDPKLLPYTLNDPVNSIDPLGLVSSNKGSGRSGQGGSNIEHFGDIGDALNQGINLPLLGEL